MAAAPKGRSLKLDTSTASASRDASPYVREITTYGYTSDGWRAVDGSKLSPIEGCTSLKVLTYNVWFADYFMSERTEQLLYLIKEASADVVCLQEVTHRIMPMLMGSRFIRENYFVTDVHGETFPRYGVVTLSKLPIVKASIHDFPTNMDRLLLKIDVCLNGETICFGNVHLESLDSVDERRSQLTISHAALKDASSALLMGDFNFDATRNFSLNDPRPLENLVLGQVMPDYIDAWEFIHSGSQDIGWTFDSSLNKVIQHDEHMRYDRVMVRSSQWAVSEVTVVGKESFQTITGHSCWISDHFGILCVLSTTSS